MRGRSRDLGLQIPPSKLRKFTFIVRNDSIPISEENILALAGGLRSLNLKHRVTHDYLRSFTRLTHLCTDLTRGNVGSFITALDSLPLLRAVSLSSDPGAAR